MVDTLLMLDTMNDYGVCYHEPDVGDMFVVCWFTCCWRERNLVGSHDLGVVFIEGGILALYVIFYVGIFTDTCCVNYEV